MVHGTPAGTGCSDAATGAGGGALGTSRRFSGRASSRCSAAHAKQAPRQPRASMNQALAGQPNVLANPANSVMPVIALRASRP